VVALSNCLHRFAHMRRSPRMRRSPCRGNPPWLPCPIVYAVSHIYADPHVCADPHVGQPPVVALSNCLHRFAHIRRSPHIRQSHRAGTGACPYATSRGFEYRFSNFPRMRRSPRRGNPPWLPCPIVYTVSHIYANFPRMRRSPRMRHPRVYVNPTGQAQGPAPTPPREGSNTVFPISRVCADPHVGQPPVVALSNCLHRFAHIRRSPRMRRSPCRGNPPWLPCPIVYAVSHVYADPRVCAIPAYTSIPQGRHRGLPLRHPREDSNPVFIPSGKFHN